MNALNHEAAELLVKTQKLIQNPENWTQGAFARDKDGITTYTTEKNAVCFCAVGALIHTSNDSVSEEVYSAAYDALEGLTTRGIPHYNDNGTHDLVMNLFTNAIVNLRKNA